MGISIIKIIRSWDRLIFIMEILILIRHNVDIEIATNYLPDWYFTFQQTNQRPRLLRKKHVSCHEYSNLASDWLVTHRPAARKPWFSAWKSLSNPSSMSTFYRLMSWASLGLELIIYKLGFISIEDQYTYNRSMCSKGENLTYKAILFSRVDVNWSSRWQWQTLRSPWGAFHQTWINLISQQSQTTFLWMSQKPLWKTGDLQVNGCEPQSSHIY